jgi:hypothetical protein
VVSATQIHKHPLPKKYSYLNTFADFVSPAPTTSTLDFHHKIPDNHPFDLYPPNRVYHGSPTLGRSISDIHQDELYNPNIFPAAKKDRQQYIPLQSDTLVGRLDEASKAHSSTHQAAQQDSQDFGLFRRVSDVIVPPLFATTSSGSNQQLPPTAVVAQVQAPRISSQALPHRSDTFPSPKTIRNRHTVKAIHTAKDHTTDQLGPEYIPMEFDEAGEKKVDSLGYLLGGREYKCRTFRLPNRGDKLFMLATECCRVLGYRKTSLLFNRNRALYKLIATQAEKDSLIQQDILPYSYRSRVIVIVTAKSIFRQFGSRIIQNGRRVRDDYWESMARKQGFTEEGLAEEKRPGAAEGRDGGTMDPPGGDYFPHTTEAYSSNSYIPYGESLLQLPPVNPDQSTMPPLPSVHWSTLPSLPLSISTAPTTSNETEAGPLTPELHDAGSFHSLDRNYTGNLPTSRLHPSTDRTDLDDAICLSPDPADYSIEVTGGMSTQVEKESQQHRQIEGDFGDIRTPRDCTPKTSRSNHYPAPGSYIRSPHFAHPSSPLSKALPPLNGNVPPPLPDTSPPYQQQHSSATSPQLPLPRPFAFRYEESSQPLNSPKNGETSSHASKAVELDKAFSIEGTNRQTEETQPSTIREPSYAPTDSGYASLALGRFQGQFKYQPGEQQITRQSPDIMEGTMPTARDENRLDSEMHEDDTIDDSGTVYSDEGSLDSWQNESYITALAADLSHRVSLKGCDEDSVDRMFNSLPGLLKTFALKVGFKGPSQIDRDAIYFVYKYRKYVKLSTF